MTSTLWLIVLAGALSIVYGIVMAAAIRRASNRGCCG
jgi:ABC-type Fe3+ transport system permease subunit